MPLILEVCFFLVPGIAVMSSPASSWVAPVLVVGCIVGGLIMSYVAMKKQGPEVAQARFEALARSLIGGRKGYVSDFRGGMVLLTCLAILAVDFPCFDRKHAKTETFGVSLMDTGVGLYVFSSGMTSAAARAPVSLHERNDCDTHDGSQKHGRSPRLPPGALQAAIIGALRMVVLKVANYQEHASEYGVHWNFFLTLASIWILAGAARWVMAALTSQFLRHSRVLSQQQATTRAAVAKSSQSGGIAWVATLLVSLLAYQAALLAHGGALTSWVMESPRFADGDSSVLAFVRANREGLLQLAPLTVLYLVAREVGLRFVWLPQASRLKPRQVKGWAVASVVTLAAAACGAWVLCGITWIALQAPSRRLANASYVLLVVAIGKTLLALVLAVHISAAATPRSATLTALGDHQLAAFVAANLLTGAVNLSSLDTIHASSTTARAVLTVYSLLVAGAARMAAVRLPTSKSQLTNDFEETREERYRRAGNFEAKGKPRREQTREGKIHKLRYRG